MLLNKKIIKRSFSIFRKTSTSNSNTLFTQPRRFMKTFAGEVGERVVRVAKSLVNGNSAEKIIPKFNRESFHAKEALKTASKVTAENTHKPDSRKFLPKNSKMKRLEFKSGRSPSKPVKTDWFKEFFKIHDNGVKLITVATTLYVFCNTYDYQLAALVAINFELIHNTDVDKEYEIIQKFMKVVSFNQNIISEFSVNNFYNESMKIHLINYVEFFEKIKSAAKPSNFMDESNYNDYIEGCDQSINLIRPIIRGTVLRQKETMAYYNALEDDDYYTNLLENASI